MGARNKAFTIICIFVLIINGIILLIPQPGTTCGDCEFRGIVIKRIHSVNYNLVDNGHIENSDRERFDNVTIQIQISINDMTDIMPYTIFIEDGVVRAFEYENPYILYKKVGNEKTFTFNITFLDLSVDKPVDETGVFGLDGRIEFSFIKDSKCGTSPVIKPEHSPFVSIYSSAVEHFITIQSFLNIVATESVTLSDGVCYPTRAPLLLILATVDMFVIVVAFIAVYGFKRRVEPPGDNPTPPQDTRPER
jgi:hypothetical protein